MQCESLIHDVAWETSRHVVELFASLLREKEQREAFAEVYERVKAALEIYQIKADRMAARLRPGKN
jgi:hypothetical protein